MRIVFLVLVSLSLYAGDILTNYRVNGITDLEKQMDLELANIKYWSDVVKNRDTTFGYMESYSNILACDKSEQTLELYILDQNGSFKFKKKYSAFTGKLKGDKVKEGDHKTPIGIYTIVQKLSKDTQLDPFYGPLAFVTSYPNLYDTYKGKNGSGIWIHGLPEQESRNEFTRGCIVINNSNIECLNRNIDIAKTFIIIDDTKVKQNIPKDILASILSQLYSWRYSWIYDEIDNYIGFYSQDFVRDDGMAFQQFKDYKSRIFKKGERKSIIFNDINILPYPNSSNIYQVNFKELYKSDSFKFTGDKTLIVELDKNKKIKIITEK